MNSQSVPWFKTRKNSDLGSTMEPTSTLLTQPEKKDGFDVKLWGWSLLSFIPWAAVDAKNRPTTINRKLRKRAQSRGLIEDDVGALRFRPYVSKVPWHTGVRGFLSQLFPRYGHYCGPNWSSGKDSGSLIWDKRPIDWLDFCCYCHDIGYDTHDQAKLLKADLAFLDCLERPNMSNKGDARIAYVYRTMCITGGRACPQDLTRVFPFANLKEAEDYQVVPPMVEDNTNNSELIEKHV